MDKLKIGIISFAHMHAYSYAECLKNIEKATLVGVADENISRGQKAAKIFKTKYFKNYRDFLKEKNLDAVIICSENSRHKEMVVESAKVSKHILCEKPISTNMKDALEMIEVCKKENVKFQISFPCRFATAVIRAKEILDSGKIGNVLAIKGTNRGRMPGSWFIEKKFSGGGAVIDHTVHVVDLMRWFLKKEVKEVYAEIDTKFNKINIDDCGMLTIEFENGVFATLDPSWSRPKSYPAGGDVTMDIIGENGVIFITDIFAQKIDVYMDKKEALQHTLVGWGSNIDMEMLKDFVDTILYDREPKITGYDGLKAMEVALGAYKSAKLKKPVNLPL